ncbi:CR-type domain-containing protein [Paraburkholderia tropica]
MVIVDLKEQAGVAMNVRGQFADPIADPQVTLGALAFANDLGRLLWRMKYGQDVKCAGMNRATLLLAKRLREPGKFDRAKFTGITRTAEKAAALTGKKVERLATDIIERFARQVIIEWIADVCVACEGRGISGRGKGGVTLRRVACPTCAGTRRICCDEYRIPFAARWDGRGPMVFREYERCSRCNSSGEIEVEVTSKSAGRQICSECRGTGRQPDDHPARARSLGVPLEQYHARWKPHFHAVHALLDALDGAANDTVRRRMQR